MESIWWVFKQIWKKTYLSGIPVQPYCPRCATPLSNFEVNEGYKDNYRPSGHSFFSSEDSSAKFLCGLLHPGLSLKCGTCSWARHPLRKGRDGDDIFILAKDRLGSYYKDLSSVQILAEMMQRTRRSGLCSHVDYFADKDRVSSVSNQHLFCPTEDGTGIVHMHLLSERTISR